MGIFNDIAAIDAFAINTYCIASALFFSACAYAQLNDPNPIQWFGAYVFGGTVPNLYWITTSGGGGGGGGGNNNNNSATTTTKNRLLLALHGFVASMGLAIVYKMVTVAPKLLAVGEIEEHHHGLLWAFLEHEEGRDSCGLLLLIFHTSYLNSVIRRGPSLSRRRVSSSSDPSATSATSSSLMMVTSPAILSFGLLCILGVSVYVWVVHHPELVAKHGLKHCQGEMFGRSGDGSEL